MRKRVSTGCVRRPSLRPPFIYLITSNKRARLMYIGRCKGCRVLKEAESSTTNRTCSGITHTVKLNCPNNPGVSHVTGRKGPSTVRFPGTGMGSTRCSFDFDKLGSTMLGCVGNYGVGNRAFSPTSLTTSFRGTMMRILINGSVHTMRGLNVGGFTVTKKITSGSTLHGTVRRTYRGHKVGFCHPSPVCYASGTTVVKTTTCCRCLTKAHSK